MKKIYSLFSVVAIVAFTLASCTNEIQTPDVYHTVEFETESLDGLKTMMEVDEDNSSLIHFKWDERDYTSNNLNWFHVWEGDKEAIKVVASYDGTLKLSATFAGEDLHWEDSYIGFMNGKVPALQLPDVEKGQYDREADVLAARSYTENDQRIFQFQRVNTFAKLTLRGIESSERLQSVVIELDKEDTNYLTGTLTLTKDKDWEWTERGKKITLNCNVECSSAPVLYFSCIPVSQAKITIRAITDKNSYTKVLGQNENRDYLPINLPKNKITALGVTMDKDERTVNTFDINIAEINKTKSLISTSYVDNKEVTVSDYKFVADRITTNNANSPESGYAASKIMQFQKNNTNTGTFKNSEEMGLNSMTILSKDANTYTVYVGTSSGSLSEIPSAKVTANNDVSCKVGSSTTKSYKSKTFDLKGYSYFRIQATSTTYIFNISLTVGESTPTGIKLFTPANLAVNEDKQIVWDRVENAGGYNVYVGGEKKNDQLLTDHYYDASAINDGYYDVEVEAVPFNTEMFAASDKATLANAKFGTPTLATPAPEVEKTNNTITLTWDTDSHATAGYAYTLYQGENVVESPSVDYNVADGVATLVYSKLSPKTAYSVKVKANLVENPLRYEASEVYTSGTISTLSTINYAALQNGAYSDQNPTYIAVGETVMFTATPANGYEFESVSVTGVDAVDIERDDDIYLFTMPDLAEVTVAVAFKQSGFTLLVADGIENGSVTINDPKERYTITDVIDLTVAPSNYYDVQSVYATDNEENILNAEFNDETKLWELKGLHFNAEVVATFKKHDYVITIPADIESYLIVDATNNKANYNDLVTITLDPAEGYELNVASLKVHGATSDITPVLNDDGDYTFTMPGEDVTINATFDAIDYTVTGVAISEICHGSVTADKSTANIGDIVTLTVAPEFDWYQLKAGTLKVNGSITPTRVGQTNQYTFTMPADNATVVAQFELVPYEVKDQTSSGEKGSLTFSVAGGAAAATVSATYNQLVTVVPVPDDGYEMTSLKLYKKGTQWSESNKVDYNPSTLTFLQPAYAVSAKAEFAKKSYNITNNGVTSGTGSFVIKNSNGTVISTAQMGDIITLDAEYADGFKVVWTASSNVTDLKTDVDDKSIATFTMPAGEVTVSAAIVENVPALEVDFEASNFEQAYPDWQFTNVTRTTSTITAHGGSYYAKTDGTTTASIQTKTKIAKPKSLEVYYAKEGGNTNSSSKFMIQVSSDGSTWTTKADGNTFNNVSQNTWYRLYADLSDCSSVYVRVYYSGTTAVRTLDDLTLEYTKPEKRTVTISNPGNGNIIEAKVGSTTISSGDKIAEGETITIVAKKATNYDFTRWKISGAEPSGSGASTTIIVGKNDINLDAEFTYNPGNSKYVLDKSDITETVNPYQESEATLTASDGSEWKIKGYGTNKGVSFVIGKGGANYLQTPECSTKIKKVIVNCSGTASYFLSLQTTKGTEIAAKNYPSTATDLVFELPDDADYTQLRLVGRRSSGTSNAQCTMYKVTVEY